MQNNSSVQPPKKENGGENIDWKVSKAGHSDGIWQVQLSKSQAFDCGLTRLLIWKTWISKVDGHLLRKKQSQPKPRCANSRKLFQHRHRYRRRRVRGHQVANVVNLSGADLMS